MFRFKLVTQDYKTRKGYPNETTWEFGKTVKVDGGDKLCTDGVLHSYESPILAVLLNPIHAGISNPRLLLVNASKIVAKDATKAGHKRITPIKELPLPTITTEERIIFAILCTKKVYSNKQWGTWADNWLSDKNRTYPAAYASAANAAAAAEAAANANFNLLVIWKEVKNYVRT